MRKKIFLAVTLLFLLSFSISFAQVLPTTNQVKAWNEFNNKYDGKFEIVWHKKTGTPKIIMGYKTEKTDMIKNGPLTVILDFFKNNERIFKIREGIDNFVTTFKKERYNSYHIQLMQTYKNLNVYTGGYKVSLTKDGSISMLNGRFYSDINIDTIPSITIKSGIQKGIDYLNINTNFIQKNGELVIYPDGRNYRLSYKIDLYYPKEREHWLVFVDAQTQDVINKYDLVYRINGKGRVYPSDPGHSDTVTVTFEELTGNGYLEGTYIDSVCHGFWEDGFLEWYRAYNQNNEFIYTPSDTSSPDNSYFNDANVYYHVTKYIKYYIKNIDNSFNLGGKITAFCNDPLGPAAFCAYKLIVFSNGFNRSGNPSGPSYDSAKKEEIIYHEVQHIVTYVQGLTGTSDETNALKEAYSDYFAGSYTNSDTCGEWVVRYGGNDPYNNPPHCRILDNSAVTFNYENFDEVSYGELNPEGDCHANGMIFSGALWDLRQELGQMVTDDITYLGLDYMDSNADFEDAFYAIRSADLTYYGGWHIDDITDVFNNRGIPSGDEKINIPEIPEKINLLKNYILYQNYPNPFNPVTNIKFVLPERSKVSLIIYDILGKEVIKLFNDENLDKGIYEITWNASNFASGIYLCRLRTGNFSKVNKLILLK